MRKIVGALSLTTLAFAGTTLYFARELGRERSRPAADDRVAALSSADAQLPHLRTTPPVAASIPADAPQAAGPESEEARSKRLMADYSRRFLRTLDDPQLRADQLVQYKMIMRNQFPRIAQILGMTSEESERFFELLALQQIENQERHSRCALEPDCRLQSLGEDPAPRAREIADLLGTERQQKFQEYQHTLVERESVSALRARLSDANFLPEDKAESLITALAAERQRMQSEATERGTGMDGFGVGIGMIFTSGDAQTPEARYESAQANSKRLRQRAAEVLTTAQLRVFDEMQDEMLVSLRAQLRKKEEISTVTTGN